MQHYANRWIILDQGWKTVCTPPLFPSFILFLLKDALWEGAFFSPCRIARPILSHSEYTCYANRWHYTCPASRGMQIYFSNFHVARLSSRRAFPHLSLHYLFSVARIPAKLIFDVHKKFFTSKVRKLVTWEFLINFFSHHLVKLIENLFVRVRRSIWICWINRKPQRDQSYRPKCTQRHARLRIYEG